MIATEPTQELKTEPMSANPRKRRLKSLIPKNVKAFPQDFFAVNETTIGVPITTTSSGSEQYHHRHSFPLEQNGETLLPDFGYIAQEVRHRFDDYQVVSSQPLFRIRSRVPMSAIIDPISRQSGDGNEKKANDGALSARGPHSATSNAAIKQVYMGPRHSFEVNAIRHSIIRPKRQSACKFFFSESTKPETEDLHKLIEKNIPKKQTLEKRRESIMKDPISFRMESEPSVLKTEASAKKISECYNTPGFKLLEHEFIASKDHQHDEKKLEVFTFAQNSPHENMAMPRVQRDTECRERNKLDFDKVTVLKPQRPKMSAYSNKNSSDKENIHPNFSKRRGMIGRPAPRFLPQIKKISFA